jgi:hypothetical protein
MQIGDLVVVKEGCGDEGKVGVILSVVGRLGGGLFGFAYYDVLFPDGVSCHNELWLERLEAADANR